MLELTRSRVSPNLDFPIVAGFLAPSSDAYLKQKLGTEAIPLVDRRAMCMLATQESNWIGVAGHGIAVGTQAAAKVKACLERVWPTVTFEPILVYGADYFTRYGPDIWSSLDTITVCVGRSGSTETVKTAYTQYCQRLAGAKPKGLLVEEELEEVSSTEIRRLLAQGHSGIAVERGWLHPRVAEYLTRNTGK
eukprot:NODE_2244_length_1254_cov_19.014108_g2043_i0.p1 GENE.NODE_2244_length_1254_cov_19.014108_g2043_i0~~NODE_2244_length_1254_cov_19.014108_g2043_i0.p1  ORF type:complete len:192 (-),score=19.44 NODE_2244_length_1254_cov_19.014108_g2043_i0:416-991(-)